MALQRRQTAMGGQSGQLGRGDGHHQLAETQGEL